MKINPTKREGKRGVSWYAVVEMPADPVTGKRRQKWVSAPTKRACEEKALDILKTAQSGSTAALSNETVREFMVRWLASIEPTVRPATHRRYTDLVTGHALPIIGGVKLAKLSPLHLQQLYADRLAAGLSSTTVHHLHAVLHRALKQALRWGLVDRNVSELVDAPRRTLPDVETWDASQVAAVLAAGDRTDLAALWRLALLCGLRRGELLGLMWDDLDLDRGTLAVRRTLSRGKGGSWETGQPKSASGRRQIALPASCVAALRKHRAAQLAERLRLGPVWQDTGYVFTNATGGPLHVNALIGRYERLVKAAGVPRLRFHDMRHTSATLLLAEGVHPKIVQERLGHANISMTLDRYSHVTQGMQRQAADVLDAALARAVEAAS